MASYVWKHSATFTQKLWLIVNDCDQEEPLIKWTSNGKCIVVNDRLFHSRICEQYPGFLKSSNLKSFKKRLNGFGFRANQPDRCHKPAKRKRTLSTPDTSVFFHPNFHKGRPDLLRYVVSQEKPQYTESDEFNIAPGTAKNANLNVPCCCCGGEKDDREEIGGGDKLVNSKKATEDSTNQDSTESTSHADAAPSFCECEQPRYSLPENSSLLHPSERFVMLPYMLTKHGYVPLAPSGLYSRSQWSKPTARAKGSKRGKLNEDEVAVKILQEIEASQGEQEEANSMDTIQMHQVVLSENEDQNHLRSDVTFSITQSHKDQRGVNVMEEDVEYRELRDTSLSLEDGDEQPSFVSLYDSFDPDLVQQAVEVAEIPGVMGGLPLDGQGWDEVPMTVADVVTVSGDD